MENNNIEFPGFKITVASIAGKDAERAKTPILPNQLAARINGFINSKIALYGTVTVRLSIEDWDEVFEVEETFFDIYHAGSTEPVNQNPRNYWIETK
jgi:hypothetical protein